MTQNEIELLKIIRESAEPEKVAAYAIALMTEYLQKVGAENDRCKA